MGSLITRALPALAWIGLVLGLSGSVYYALGEQAARELDAGIADGSLVARGAIPDRADAHYAAGWIHELTGAIEPALQAYAQAESARDTALAARAKFAMGNVYLRTGLIAGDVAAGGSHVRGLAQLQLAREAYRGALRLDPELRDARYNLELLERLSPQRRVQGWQREQEGVQLRQSDEQGWAAMKEGDKVRGLP